MKVSVLILTLNEEQNIGRCLDALSWSDDVVVVDSFSSDRTVEIATRLGARVVQREFIDFANQRNFGLRECGLRHDWVLHLDADEVVMPQLRDEIAALGNDPAIDGYRIAGRMMMGEKWLKHSGMFPVHQVRLTRRDGFRFEQVGHGQREGEGQRLATLRNNYLHYFFSKGLSDWFERHNRYSTDEARHATVVGWPRLSQLVARDAPLRRRALKALGFHLPFRPFLRFAYMYVLRRGFLDGRAGYEYSRLMSIYEAMIDMKVRELRRSCEILVADDDVQPACGGDVVR
ncbi:MAG: glycosyltransferase family 2 protein [Thermoanaerobaculia bacterium]